MAIQTNKPDAGEDIADPTRTGRPAAPTYRMKIEPNGDLRPMRGYGQNGDPNPSSVSVGDANALAALDITPKGGDAVRDLIARGGFGDHSDGGSPIDDLRRKIDTTAYPTTFGMRNRSGEVGPGASQDED